MTNSNKQLERADARRSKAEKDLCRADQRIQRLLIKNALAHDGQYQDLLAQRLKLNATVHHMRVRITKKNTRVRNLLKNLAIEMRLVVEAQEQERAAVEDRERVNLRIESTVRAASETTKHRQAPAMAEAMPDLPQPAAGAVPV